VRYTSVVKREVRDYYSRLLRRRKPTLAATTCVGLSRRRCHRQCSNI